jgi:hypothetical protein
VIETGAGDLSKILLGLCRGISGFHDFERVSMLTMKVL